MSEDQCRQLNNPTTSSQDLHEIGEIQKFESECDPYFVMENGEMNEDDECSQPQNSQNMENLSDDLSIKGIPFPQHHYQREDHFNLGLVENRPKIPKCQKKEINGQEEANPCFHSNQSQQIQLEEHGNQNSQIKNIQQQISLTKREYEDVKTINKPTKNQKKIKKKAKRIKQQMKSLGENIYYKFKKNVNMPKAIGRYLIAFHKQYKSTLFKNYEEQFTNLSNKLKEKSEWIKKDKKNCFKLEHLKQIFSNEGGAKSSTLNRLLMRKIIQAHKKKQIIVNNQVKDKLEYLVSTKIYSLRCSNSALATRMQMR